MLNAWCIGLNFREPAKDLSPAEDPMPDRQALTKWPSVRGFFTLLLLIAIFQFYVAS
jgi:hypothetical protein